MVRIFNHMYLNDSLVAEALSALEGGTLDQTEEVERSGNQKAIGAEVALGPAGIKGGMDKAASSEKKTTRSDTPEARLLRLITIAENADALRYFDASTTDADWYEVRRGELFEAHGQVEIGFMSSLDKPVADIRAFLDVAEALGLDESIDLPDKEIQQMEAVATTARERSVPFVFYLNGSKTCRAVGELEREHLRVSTSRVSGEFTVFLKVTGMIEKGETFDMTGMIGDIINLGASANRKQRRASRKARLGGKSKSNDDPKFTLKGPALKVTPYAIVI